MPSALIAGADDPLAEVLRVGFQKVLEGRTQVVPANPPNRSARPPAAGIHEWRAGDSPLGSCARAGFCSPGALRGPALPHGVVADRSLRRKTAPPVVPGGKGVLTSSYGRSAAVLFPRRPS